MTDTNDVPADAEAELSPQVRLVLLALIVGGIAAILDSTMVTLATHTLVRKLHYGGRPPILDIRLLRRRSLGSASTVLFTTGAAMYAAMFLLPLYYQQLRGDTVLHAGLILIQGVGALGARLIVGNLVDRFGARAVTIASFLLAAAATVPFALAGPHTSQWLLGAMLLIRGVGIGAVLIPSMSVAYQDVPPAGIPHATMNTRIAQQVGASFGVAIVAVALQSALAHGATTAFQEAFWWSIGITIAAAVPAIALPAKKPAGHSPSAKPVDNDRDPGSRVTAQEAAA
jgi:MFS family permease